MTIEENPEHVIIGVGNKFAWMSMRTGQHGETFASVKEAMKAGPHVDVRLIAELCELHEYMKHAYSRPVGWKEDFNNATIKLRTLIEKYRGR